MRVVILLMAICAAQAGVVSRDWADGKLALRLDDGVAELEWISGTSFHFSHGGLSLPMLPKIKHERVASEFEDARGVLTLRGRYMTVEIEKATAKLRVSVNKELIGSLSFDTSTDDLTVHVSPIERAFGLTGPGDAQRFFFNTNYGVYVRAPQQCAFDLASGTVRAPSTRAMDVFFYYGPTPKEIFEQHQIVTGRTEIPGTSLRVRYSNNLPSSATPLPDAPIDSWGDVAALLRTLNQWSLSGVLYPAFDLSALRALRGELGRRAADLAAMIPLLYGNPELNRVDEREMWTPYLTTYLREAYDRGYPLIRPLPVQFSRDKLLDPQPAVFMLGDEVLLAPVTAPAKRWTLKLPRGVWTDIRTDAIYKGEQTVEVEAPPGSVPTFARSGAILPLAMKNAMELNYFPSLGGEFFLWEPEKNDNSQFHAAPAGDFTRLEVESLVSRTYEWIIHHASKPASVKEGDVIYTSVRQRSGLKSGTWWHDDSRNDLHVLIHTEEKTDKIVNISF